MLGTGTDTRNISVKETDKTPYFMEFIKVSRNKHNIANISPLEKRHKVLQGLVIGLPPIREGRLFQRKCPVS